MWYRVQRYPYIKDTPSLIQKKNYYLFVNFWFTNISIVLFSIDLFFISKKSNVCKPSSNISTIYFARFDKLEAHSMCKDHQTIEDIGKKPINTATTQDVYINVSKCITKGNYS